MNSPETSRFRGQAGDLEISQMRHRDEMKEGKGKKYQKHKKAHKKAKKGKKD